MKEENIKTGFIAPILDKNIGNNYNDNIIASPEMMENIAKKYFEEINSYENNNYFNYNKIFLLLKENCRILYIILNYLNKKSNKNKFAIVQKIIIKCEKFKKIINPFVNNILEIKNKSNLNKYINICTINFAEIIYDILNQNKNDFTSSFIKPKNNFIEINNKLINFCLNSIKELQTL